MLHVTMPHCWKSHVTAQIDQPASEKPYEKGSDVSSPSSDIGNP